MYPNNAIVGGSGDIHVGAALYKKVNRNRGSSSVNIGDASSSCGPVWEGLCFAVMDQFKKLWQPPYRGGLPLIVNFMNNFYGMGGQPQGETMGFGLLARLGAGLNPEQMHVERVDGFNPLAVADAIARKKEILEKGDGPVMLDTITYRYSGHSPSDQSSYRQKEEVQAWQDQDPTVHYANDLVRVGICDRKTLDAIAQKAETLIVRACKKAVDLSISPRADLKKTGCLLERTMFSNQKIESMDTSRRGARAREILGCRD